MQALILSAGLGTRLRPLTDDVPKVMVPIGDKPVLEHHIEHLKKIGVTGILINLHYLPEVIKNYFGDGSRFGVNIIYKYEPEILGTAGAVKNFEDCLEDEFFVIYGDVLSFVDYGRFKEFFNAKPNAIGAEIVGDTDHPFDSDLVEVDEYLRFKKIYTKPHSQIPERYKSMKAIFILKREILDFIPQGKYYEIDHQLLPDILSRGFDFYGYETKDYLKDIGTMDRYKMAQKDYIQIKNH